MDERVLFYSDDDRGAPPEERPIPEDQKEAYDRARDRMFEMLADVDEQMEMAYLEEREVSAVELKKALRRATLAGQITPVLCGTALKNKGTRPLLTQLSTTCRRLSTCRRLPVRIRRRTSRVSAPRTMLRH